MPKMKVATIGIKFDGNIESNVVSINLFKGTEILSVQAENNESTLWICFMSPSESFSPHSKREDEAFQFIIAKCKCTYAEIEIDDHKYIGNINVSNDTYAIFYKKVEKR